MKKILVVLTALMLFSTSALATSFDDLLWLQNWQNNNNNSGTVELGDPSMALPALGVLAVAAGAGIIVAEKKRK